uniref:DPH-type MB domain-containing protein n=1 Tax=Crocodylus porosus TaxID=8502 RepID=A0A7M4FR42_CROPO
ETLYFPHTYFTDIRAGKDFMTSLGPAPCPKGKKSAGEDLENGEDVATCPSCSLLVRVIYDQEQFMRDEIVSEPTTSKELVKC